MYHKSGTIQLKKKKKLSSLYRVGHLSVSTRTIGYFKSGNTYIILFCHTYIHNWPLQPFSQDYGLAYHTTHVVCVKFYAWVAGPTV